MKVWNNFKVIYCAKWTLSKRGNASSQLLSWFFGSQYKHTQSSVGLFQFIIIQGHISDFNIPSQLDPFWRLICQEITQIFPFFAGMTVPGSENKNHSVHRYRHHEKRSNDPGRQKFAGLYTGPYFDPAMPSNVSVQLDDTALLICKVNQVGRKTVIFLLTDNHQKQSFLVF